MPENDPGLEQLNGFSMTWVLYQCMLIEQCHDVRMGYAKSISIL